MFLLSKSSALWLWSGLAGWALAGVFAATDNLTELAPVFLLLGGGALGMWQWGRRANAAEGTTAEAISGLAWVVRGLAGLGLAGLGLSAVGLAVPSLRELAPVGFLGLLLLALAALMQVAERIRTKEVSATGGGLTIAAGLIFLGVGVGGGLALTAAYFLLRGLGLV